MHPHPDAVRHPALAAGRCRPSVTSRDRITHIASDLGHAKDQGQVALRHFEYASEPRWLADFGPEWARGVLLDAEDGGFLETPDGENRRT